MNVLPSIDLILPSHSQPTILGRASRDRVYVERVVAREDSIPRPDVVNWSVVSSTPTDQPSWDQAELYLAASAGTPVALSFTAKGFEPAADGTSIAPILDLTMKRSIETQEATLLSLSRDWDGEGAEPVDRTRLELIVGLLRQSLSGRSAPLPELVPGGDGSIQAELRFRGGISIYYGVDATGEEYFYGSTPQDTWSSTGPDSRRDFATAISTYSPTSVTRGSSQAAERRFTI